MPRSPTTLTTGVISVSLKSFEERVPKGLSAPKILADVRQQLMQIDDAFAFVLEPPSVPGIGTGGGLKLYVQDRAGRGLPALEQATWMDMLRDGFPPIFALRIPFKIGFKGNRNVQGRPFSPCSLLPHALTPVNGGRVRAGRSSGERHDSEQVSELADFVMVVPCRRNEAVRLDWSHLDLTAAASLGGVLDTFSDIKAALVACDRAAGWRGCLH